jgi:hypothetical protein
MVEFGFSAKDVDVFVEDGSDDDDDNDASDANDPSRNACFWSLIDEDPDVVDNLSMERCSAFLPWSFSVLKFMVASFLVASKFTSTLSIYLSTCPILVLIFFLFPSFLFVCSFVVHVQQKGAIFGLLVSYAHQVWSFAARHLKTTKSVYSKGGNFC